MTIEGTTASIIRLLRTRYLERFGDLGGYSFRAFSSADFTTGVTDQLSLFLYRVDIDRTRRQMPLPRESPTGPARHAMSLELRYLLTVWGPTAESEQAMLSACMRILDQNAILSGDLLDPAHDWQDGFEIQLSLESMTNDDMFRIWDAFEPPYHLSVPYLARVALLDPVERPEAPMVGARTNIYVPAVP